MLGQVYPLVMKFHNACSFVLACSLMVFGITGCVTTGKNGSAGANTPGMTGNIKTQGVYTTLAMNGTDLDMPASGYIQKNSFGPGEVPAAVIIGYGNYNQQQLVTLELIEADTRRSLSSRDSYAAYGKAEIQTLSIRLSGNYKLRLTSGGTELDNWQFTVTRTNSSGTVQVDAANATASYGQGTFGIDIGPDNTSDFFDAYDDQLTYTMLNVITKEAGASTNDDLFAQRFPGKVVIQCNLDFQGRLTDPKILENTMDGDCAGVFQKALLDHSPYSAWPEGVRQKFGSDNRELKLTVSFD